MGKSPEKPKRLSKRGHFEQIQHIHEIKRHTYGCRKIYQELRRNGLKVNHKRVK